MAANALSVCQTTPDGIFLRIFESVMLLFVDMHTIRAE